MPSKRDLGGEDTLSFDGGPPQACPDNGPPVTGWDRYELFERLGKGGMGEVYRARDHRLDRELAVKFIIGADANLAMRFLREARAQARIDHPNVCRVHEVGAVEGRPYIALQLIQGEVLKHAAARMSFDQRITAIRDVAIAIQEAHRLGIIHRDLKPANIMVERTDDGRWIPVVMDFGLAREATVEAGITLSGALLGTPAYMSPEQARGDVRAVDHRADIYSLGATLYELLVGHPPFADASVAVVLARAINDEPTPPRSLVPSIPVDLETVTLKCLAKDPLQRYQSARALADDLQRCLDGEPILGRRLPRWQRVQRYARRHRAVVVLGGWSLAIVVVIGSLGVRAWSGSRSERAQTIARTRLAERLGREATELEGALRSAYQRPLHDTRADREDVRARMRIIAATPQGLGELGDAIVHDALGRGHLALHEWREAADELAQAEAAGLQLSGLHAARGRALGALYHRAVEEARRVGDTAWLARRRLELEGQLLIPALVELALSRAAGEGSELLEAEVALYLGDFVRAEQRARVVAERSPGAFEAHRLAADAALGAAVEAFDRGSYDAARVALERSTARYAEASDIARSDPTLHEASAQAWLQRAEVDFRQGQAPRDPIAHALEAVDRAIVADPDDARTHTLRGYVLLRRYRTPALREPGDARGLLGQIEQAAARAVELDRHDARAWDALGNARYFRGQYEQTVGGPARAWWDRAAEALGQALAVDERDAWANNDLGIIRRSIGELVADAGEDPTTHYQAAARYYQRAATIDPRYLFAWTNSADLQAQIADHESARGIDPREAVRLAHEAADRGLAIDPNFYSLLGTIAQAHLAAARFAEASGGDPTDQLAIARGYLERSDTVRPDNMATFYYRLSAASTEARFLLRDHADPSAALAAGRVARDTALRLEPASYALDIEVARFDLVEATSVARSSGDPTALLAAARIRAEAAIEINDQSTDACLAAAEVYLQLALAQRSRKLAERGLAYVDRALALNPHLPGAEATRAALASAFRP